jgi:hypothetical protein
MGKQLVAVFSEGIGTFFIAVTPHGSYDLVAAAHPSGDDDPIKALAALGYKPADGDTRRTFPRTVRATGYRNIRVVPVS